MTLLLPIRHLVTGGVERCVIETIREFLDAGHTVVLVSDPKVAAVVRRNLTRQDRLICLALCPARFSLLGLGSAFSNLFRRVCRVISPRSKLQAKIECGLEDAYFRRLIEQYQVDAVLNLIGNFHRPLNTSLVQGVVIHDLFWREMQSRYSAEYRECRDKWLLSWIKQADILFPISESTAKSLEAFAAGYFRDIRVVSLPAAIYEGGDRFEEVTRRVKELSGLKLYYPGGTSEHKNHLILLKALGDMISSGHDISLVLTGVGTAPTNYLAVMVEIRKRRMVHLRIARFGA